MPPWASGPTLTVRSPILIGAACAIAGAGKRPSAATAVALDRSVRRLSLEAIISSRCERLRLHSIRGRWPRFTRLFRRPLRLFGRNNRQKQIGFCGAAKSQPGSAVKDIGRPVAQIVMQERPATGQLILKVEKPPAGSYWIDVVFAADRQSDAVPRGDHDRCRPDFDV